MVKYIGEADAPYHGDQGSAYTKNNMWGGDVVDDEKNKGVAGSSLKDQNLQPYLQGFGSCCPYKGLPNNSAENPTGFGPGGVADPRLGANQKGQAVAGQKPGIAKHAIQPSANSMFLESEGTFPMV